ncbi:MAG TPA: hypothetical protein VKT82_02180 [Ktedonobacterales bacterium]|nr:hypothetical protein [Ktedonobacterales bacterium]
MYRHRHHSLLGIAVLVFLIWLAFVVLIHVVGWVIHLLWIIILVAFIWWLFRVLFGSRRARW